MLAQANRDIQRMKGKLIRAAKRKGIYENFGQKEVRELWDRYNPHVYEEWGLADAILAFENWAMDYTG